MENFHSGKKREIIFNSFAMSNQGKIKSFIFDLLILLTLSLIPLVWFPKDYIVTGHDAAYPINVLETFKDRLFTWNSVETFGRDNTVNLGAIPIHGIEAFFTALGFSLTQSQKFTFVWWFLAMSLAMYKDEEGKTLYEKYPGDFDAGCIVNTGSCVSNAHPIGAVIKIASIFAKRNLRGNFEEISDYILNRIGAVAIAWGSQHQKAMAIATGANRLGVPVILGPQGVKHRRAYLGRSEDNEKWMVLNARDGKKVYGGPAPEHLLYVAETIEETMVMAARLVMRPNDTPKGRMIKLSNYINLHKQLYGTMPDDVQRFVRAETDIPVTMKDDVIPVLKERGWKPIEIPDPTLLDRMVLRRE